MTYADIFIQKGQCESALTDINKILERTGEYLVYAVSTGVNSGVIERLEMVTVESASGNTPNLCPIPLLASQLASVKTPFSSTLSVKAEVVTVSPVKATGEPLISKANLRVDLSTLLSLMLKENWVS